MINLPEYGKLNKLIEDALAKLEYYREGKLEEQCNLIEIMNEANLVAFNAKTVELVISGEVEKALCDNELEIIIRRIYRKPISEITTESPVLQGGEEVSGNLKPRKEHGYNNMRDNKEVHRENFSG